MPCFHNIKLEVLRHKRIFQNDCVSFSLHCSWTSVDKLNPNRRSHFTLHHKLLYCKVCTRWSLSIWPTTIKNRMRFEVLMAVKISMLVFRVLTLCGLVVDTSISDKHTNILLHLLGWRWKQYVPLKCRYLPTSPLNLTTQKTSVDRTRTVSVHYLPNVLQSTVMKMCFWNIHIVSADKTWVHHNVSEIKKQSMLWMQGWSIHINHVSWAFAETFYFTPWAMKSHFCWSA
jgi:hypothetical protein